VYSSLVQTHMTQGISPNVNNRRNQVEETTVAVNETAAVQEQSILIQLPKTVQVEIDAIPSLQLVTN